MRKRNGNYQQIVEKLSLKMGQDFCVGGKSGKRAPQLTHVFEHLFWLGDLNYRLDHLYSHAVNLVAKGDWEVKVFQVFLLPYCPVALLKDSCFFP